MGKSVLTPEEILLGKASPGRREFARADAEGDGGKGIRANIPKPVCGEL